MKRLIIFLFGWIFIQSNAQIIGLCIDTSNSPIPGIEIYDKTIGKVSLNLDVDGKARYLNLGEWFNYCTYAVADENGLRLEKFEK